MGGVFGPLGSFMAAFPLKFSFGTFVMGFQRFFGVNVKKECYAAQVIKLSLLSGWVFELVAQRCKALKTAARTIRLGS